MFPMRPVLLFLFAYYLDYLMYFRTGQDGS